MFIYGLESLRDHLTWYYVVAVFVSILAVVIAFFFSNRNYRSIHEEKKERYLENEEQEKEQEMETAKKGEDETDVCEEDVVKKNIKQSPALMAEMVIKANMTEEQRSLEQEVRKKQLAEIFKLMSQETDKFGEVSLLEIEEQMKLYQ